MKLHSRKLNLINQPQFKQVDISEVTREAGPDASAQDIVLEQLCRLHWPTLYWHARRSGYESSEAEDLAQGFFATLFARSGFSNYDPKKGNLRTFLLVAFRRYLIDHLRHQAAKKEGGDYSFVSYERSPELSALEDDDQEDPSSAADRTWARALLREARDMLQKYYEDAGKAVLFERIKLFLDASEDHPEYETVALELKMTPGALRSAIFRMRRHMRGYVLAVVAKDSGGKDDDLLSDLVGSLHDSEGL